MFSPHHELASWSPALNYKRPARRKRLLVEPPAAGAHDENQDSNHAQLPKSGSEDSRPLGTPLGTPQNRLNSWKMLKDVEKVKILAGPPGPVWNRKAGLSLWPRSVEAQHWLRGSFLRRGQAPGNAGSWPLMTIVFRPGGHRSSPWNNLRNLQCFSIAKGGSLFHKPLESRRVTLGPFSRPACMLVVSSRRGAGSPPGSVMRCLALATTRAISLALQRKNISSGMSKHSGIHEFINKDHLPDASLAQDGDGDLRDLWDLRAVAAVAGPTPAPTWHRCSLGNGWVLVGSGWVYDSYIFIYDVYLDLHLALFSAHSSFGLDLRSFWLFMLTWTRNCAFVSWRTGIYVFFPVRLFPGKIRL